MYEVFYSLVFSLFVLMVFFLAWLWLLRKHVATVPSLTVALDKPSYEHGETVNVSGRVYSDVGVPAPNETITLTVTDAAGNPFTVGSAVSDDKGAYTASFVVSSAMSAGIATLDATDAKLGATATVTFTLSNT